MFESLAGGLGGSGQSSGGQSGGLDSSGSSYESAIKKTLTQSFGPVAFGDVNAGAGSGSGFRLTGTTLAIIGAVTVAILYILKR